MSGAKINVSDVNIKEDKIIMEDLNPIKHHLTESAWTLLNEEGEVVSQLCIFIEKLSIIIRMSVKNGSAPTATNHQNVFAQNMTIHPKYCSI